MEKYKVIKTKCNKTNSQIVELQVPQMGEGLQEVRIVRLLKNPNDLIIEDEVVYEMETDKALFEIESAYAGKLIKWLIKEGDILPIGTTLAIIELLK